jgi:hypothetical protein
MVMHSACCQVGGPTHIRHLPSGSWLSRRLLLPLSRRRRRLHPCVQHSQRHAGKNAVEQKVRRGVCGVHAPQQRHHLCVEKQRVGRDAALPLAPRQPVRSLARPSVRIAVVRIGRGSHRGKLRLTIRPELGVRPAPSELLASPSELIASPSELLVSPSELLTSPSELLASPSELLTSPSELLTSPSELLTSPSELLASPSALLTSPSELLASPSELLASPSELLTSPSELSASPSEVAASPSDIAASLRKVARLTVRSGYRGRRYLRYFKGHRDQVVAVCMSPKTDAFLSASLDKTMRLWDLRTNACQVRPARRSTHPSQVASPCASNPKPGTVRRACYKCTAPSSPAWRTINR